MSFQQFFDAYLVAALWSSTDDDGNPLDDRFGPDDIAPESLESARAECEDFYAAHESTWRGQYDAANPARAAQWPEDALAGHDFCLTRNGHGAGFWDRGMRDVGKALTAACRPYGGSDAYVGDDGRVYLT